MTTPFSDLDTFLAIPRLGGLRLSGDGSRLVTTLATLNAKRTQYRTALWQIDPAGELPAKRLTRSRRGESSGLFTDSGDVLFTSSRPDPDGGDHDDVPALWLLPASGGEARVIGSRPGGFGRVQASGSTVLVAAQRLPGAADEAAEASLRRERRDRSVSAMLHTGYPVRHWDSDTGPGATHLLAATLPPDETPGETPSRLALRDVTRGPTGMRSLTRSSPPTAPSPWSPGPGWDARANAATCWSASISPMAASARWWTTRTPTRSSR